MAGEAALPGPVAVVMSRFPAVTETFILRELVEMERAGAEVVLVPLLREHVETLHEEAAAWDRRALYTPFLNGAIAAANLRVLLSRPLLWLGTLAALLWEARSSWNAWSGVLGIFPKSVYHGQRLRERGVVHVHAHFATHPAASAYVMSRVRARGQAELPYSLTIHAHDIFIHVAGLPRKLGAASFVRCISRFNVEWLRTRLGAGAPPADRFRVIHCGIEPERYRHAPAAGRPGSDRPARLLAIASHRPYKGIAFLVEAMRLLGERGADVVCDVIGDGPLRPQLERQIERAALGGRFRLLGSRTQREVAEALAGCDLFVLPSVVAPDGQMEGIPVVLMEALAAGVPVLATRLSGIPELVVPERTGHLAPPADAGALAAGVQDLLDDYPRALALARAGQQLVREQFEIRGCVRRLLEAIRAATPR